MTKDHFGKAVLVQVVKKFHTSYAVLTSKQDVTVDK
jgi:hypothetical protein